MIKFLNQRQKIVITEPLLDFFGIEIRNQLQRAGIKFVVKIQTFWLS